MANFVNCAIKKKKTLKTYKCTSCWLRLFNDRIFKVFLISIPHEIVYSATERNAKN
jgi:hypothetical protein